MGQAPSVTPNDPTSLSHLDLDSRPWSIRTAPSLDETYDNVFCRLPPEILDQLLDYLDYSTLRDCTFVNSAFYHEIKRRLCRRVQLQLQGVPGVPGEPTFTGELVRRSMRDDGFFNDEPTRWTKCWVKEYVRCLDVEVHDSTQCEGFDFYTQRVIHMATDAWAVRFRFTNVDGRALFHTNGDPTVHQQCCKVFSERWKVRIVVLRDPPAYFRGVTGLLRPHVSASVQTAVYLLGPLFLGAHGTPRDTLYLHTFPSEMLHDSTVVFSAMPGDPFCPMLPEHEPWDNQTCAKWLDRLIAALVTSHFQLVEKMRTRLTIVNAGAIPLHYLGSAAPPASATPSHVQAAVEKVYRNYIKTLLPPAAVAKHPLMSTGRGITFLTMKEYIAQGGRYYLDGNMVAAWDVVVDQ